MVVYHRIHWYEIIVNDWEFSWFGVCPLEVIHQKRRVTIYLEDLLYATLFLAQAFPNANEGVDALSFRIHYI